jgi:orotate phosphoribosyltransferase
LAGWRSARSDGDLGVPRYHQHGRAIEGFFVRKQAKDHGSQARVEGQLKSGDRVVVIDDVLTTGGSVLQAIEAVEKSGAYRGAGCLYRRSVASAQEDWQSTTTGRYLLLPDLASSRTRKASCLLSGRDW